MKSEMIIRLPIACEEQFTSTLGSPGVDLILHEIKHRDVVIDEYSILHMELMAVRSNYVILSPTYEWPEFLIQLSASRCRLQIAKDHRSFPVRKWLILRQCECKCVLLFNHKRFYEFHSPTADNYHSCPSCYIRFGTQTACWSPVVLKRFQGAITWHSHCRLNITLKYTSTGTTTILSMEKINET